ncbi:hypothetical protein AGDE_01881 [Angomonas deanei]|nr:hypothetical protein AGDE_01881 [Angomonas deanei]|eukprot:EPY42042.1 hypothetical protein AGDE_01881 [Angomonas deanei]
MADEKDSNVVQAFLAAGPDGKDCFRMFGRAGQPGCFVLGWWASYVAKEYIKSSAVLKSWSSGEEKVDVVVVNDTLCKEIIRDCLMRMGVGVEYYERQSGGSSFTCVQRGTPGNTADFEATLFEFEEVNVQLSSSGALVLSTSSEGGMRVAFATLNATLRQISFAEYDDTMMMSSLDALFVQTSLKELTLLSPAGLKEEENVLRSLHRICERAGVILNTAKPIRQKEGGKPSSHSRCFFVSPRITLR